MEFPMNHSLLENLRRNSSEHADVKAFINYDSGEEFSWKNVHQEAGQIAANLKKKFPESRYALLVSSHHPEFFLSIFACWFAGIVPIPVNDGSKNADFDLYKKVLNDEDPLIILAGDIRDLSCKNIFRVSENKTSEVVYSPVSNALGLFTSGTTALPKLMIFSHADLYHAAVIENENEKFSAGRRIANLRPHFTSGGLNTFWPMIFSAGSLILSERMRKIAMERFMVEFLSKSHPDLLVLSPSWIAALSDTLTSSKKADSLPVYFGGMSIDEKTITTLIDSGFVPYMRYGMTEVGHIISKRKIEKDDPIQRNNMGRGFENVPVKRIGDKLAFKTNGAASFEMQNGRLIPTKFQDGHFVSDDAGDILDDGSISLTGRDATIANVNGFRFNVLQVEEFLKKSGLVSDCRVLVTSDNSHGNVLTCYCLLSGNGSLQEIEELCKKDLPSFKWPQNYVSLSVWPYLSNGKLDIARLKALS